MTGLLLPPVTTGQKAPPPVQRAPNDVCYDRAANAFFTLVERAERVAAIDRTRAKLIARLDDPSLADEYPPDHPDRVAAETRCSLLLHERRDAVTAIVRQARAIDRAYAELPGRDRQEFAAALRLAWFDHPAVELIRTDPTAGRLAVWRDVLGGEGQIAMEIERCPF